MKTTAVGVLVHLCTTDPKRTLETVKKAGVHSTADTVYTVGSAVVGSYLLFALHVDAAMIIIYKISCGLCGGTTSRNDEETVKVANKVTPFGM